MVAQWCAGRGIPHATLSPSSPITGSIQASARAARYALLHQWRQERALGWLLTAHHADDQLETLLMRLNRSSGVGGLAGIRARNGTVLRPMLSWRRAELMEIARAQGLCLTPAMTICGLIGWRCARAWRAWTGLIRSRHRAPLPPAPMPMTRCAGWWTIWLRSISAPTEKRVGCWIVMTSRGRCSDASSCACSSQPSPMRCPRAERPSIKHLFSYCVVRRPVSASGCLMAAAGCGHFTLRRGVQADEPLLFAPPALSWRDDMRVK